MKITYNDQQLDKLCEMLLKNNQTFVSIHEFFSAHQIKQYLLNSVVLPQAVKNFYNRDDFVTMLSTAGMIATFELEDQEQSMYIEFFYDPATGTYGDPDSFTFTNVEIDDRTW